MEKKSSTGEIAMGNRTNKKKLKGIQGVALQEFIEQGDLPRNFHLFDASEMRDWESRRRRQPFLPWGNEKSPGKARYLGSKREY